MSKIYFGKNIKTQSGNFSNVFTSNFKTNLTDVYSLPMGLVNISQLFHNCINLKNVNYEFENTLVNIRNTFRNCYNFQQSINIPYSIVDGAYAFDSSGIKNANFINIGRKGLPLNLVSCFRNCKNLDTVGGTISNHVNCLESCFQNSSIVNTPELEDGCTPYMNYMFSNCRNMKYCNTTIPNYYNLQDNRTDYLFYNCYNLRTIKNRNLYFYSFINGFHNCSNLSTGTLYVSAMYLNNAFSNAKIDHLHINGCYLNNTFSNAKINDFSVVGYYFNNTFHNCNFNNSKTYNINGYHFNNTFYNCNNLTNIHMNFIDNRYFNDKYIINGENRSLSGDFMNQCNDIRFVNISGYSFDMNANVKCLHPNCWLSYFDNDIFVDNEFRTQLNSNQTAFYTSKCLNINACKGSPYVYYVQDSGTYSNLYISPIRKRTNYYDSTTEQQILPTSSGYIIQGNGTRRSFDIVYYMDNGIFPYNSTSNNVRFVSANITIDNLYTNCNDDESIIRDKLTWKPNENCIVNNVYKIE